MVNQLLPWAQHLLSNDGGACNTFNINYVPQYTSMFTMEQWLLICGGPVVADEWAHFEIQNSSSSPWVGMYNFKMKGLGNGSYSGVMGKLRISLARRSATHFSRSCRMSVSEKQSTPPVIERRSMKTMTKTPQSWPLHGWTAEQCQSHIGNSVEHVVPLHRTII